MVNLTIDKKAISVPEGTSILDAAAMNGLMIPTLCFQKDLNEIGACRLCCVEMWRGMKGLLPRATTLSKKVWS